MSKGRTRGIMGLAGALLLSGAAAHGQDLDQYIQDQMALAGLPGLGVRVIYDGQVLWSNTYGWADIDLQEPIATDTIFTLASCSKLVTAISLMRLYEQGLFALDDDVGDYTPFPVRNPAYPDTPITFKMILSHVSSIQNNADVMDALRSYGGDRPVPLDRFLQGYLVPGGEYYEVDNYRTAPPASEYRKSHINYALAGYLVELLSGIPLDQYAQQEIFAPLGITDATWMLADTDMQRLATPYVYTWPSGPFVAQEHYDVVHWPSGGLRTSVPGYDPILQVLMYGGACDGVRILEPATVALMLTPPYPDLNDHYGLGVLMWDLPNGELLAGQDGLRNEGATAGAVFRPLDRLGVIVFCNGYVVPARRTAFFAIMVRLFEEFDQVCPTDLNRDGAVNSQDFIAFLNLFTVGDPDADFNADGLINSQDFITFLNAFVAGC